MRFTRERLRLVSNSEINQISSGFLGNWGLEFVLLCPHRSSFVGASTDPADVHSLHAVDPLAHRRRPLPEQNKESSTHEENQSWIRDRRTDAAINYREDTQRSLTWRSAIPFSLWDHGEKGVKKALWPSSKGLNLPKDEGKSNKPR